MTRRAQFSAMAIALLALAGGLDSLYLLLSRGRPVPCALTGGCAAVQSSAYSVFPPQRGVPVALLGLIGFAAVCGLALLALGRERLGPWRLFGWLAAASGGGVLFAAYLTVVEAFVLHAWCQWCLLAAGLIAACWALSFAEWLRGREPRRAAAPVRPAR
ncbi:MAG TPA: vitamin K epoxide reductase family protein [Herpetosiphonaceae bacterium]